MDSAQSLSEKERGCVKDQPPRRDRSRNLGFPFPFAGFRAGFPRQVRAVLLEGEGVFLQADLRIGFGFPCAGNIGCENRDWLVIKAAFGINL